MMKKKNRHFQILGLIDSVKAQSQQEFLDELAKLDIHISQSTLSKDLKELGVIKMRGKNGKFRFLQTKERDAFHTGVMLKKELLDFFMESTVVGNLLVIRTVQGNASGVSKFLDEIGWPEIVGTLASVDTVLAITRTPADAKAAMEKLQEMLTNNK